MQCIHVTRQKVIFAVGVENSLCNTKTDLAGSSSNIHSIHLANNAVGKYKPQIIQQLPSITVAMFVLLKVAEDTATELVTSEPA